MRCQKYSRLFGSIDRVDRWAVWRVLASLLPQTTLPQASPAAQLELDTRARRLRARGVAETLSWVPFGAAPPQVTRPPPPTIPPKPPRPSSPGTTMLGQSPLTLAHCGSGGARSLARSRARCVAVAMAFGYTARHARYARRASRARTRTSSPRIARVVTVFRPPSTHACARCALRRRSLARSRACGVALAVAVEVAFSYIARHARHARARARHRRASRASSPPPFPDVTHARARQRRRRCLVCSLARARGGGGGEVGGGGRLHRASRLSNTSRASLVTRAHAHVITASRASSPFSVPPRARPARARCCGGGARSLARTRAVWRWRWRWRSVTPRTTRVTRVIRARVHVITAHRARHHRPPSPMSPMRARGSGGGAVSFARLLARAEAEADGHSHVVRVSRVTRARARVILATALVSATPIEVRSFRRRLVFSSLFSLVFSFFVSPRAHYDETTGDM